MVTEINEFTNEQCERMKQHIKTMLDTNIVNYIITFANQFNFSDSSHEKQIIAIDEPFHENSHLKNALIFSTFEDVDKFVTTCFHSYKEFFNQMYMINSYTKMSQYIQNIIEYIKDDPINCNVVTELKREYYNDVIFIFDNIYFKDYTIKESFIPNYNEKNFYHNDLTNMDEVKYFLVKRYYNTIFSFEYKYKLEAELNKFLLNYRHCLTDFNNAENYMKQAEEIFLSHIVDRYQTNLKLKNGIDNRFENSLKEVITDLTNTIITKKIQYGNIEYKYTFIKSNDIINDIYEILHDTCPELTKNMMTGYYKCMVTLNFKNPLSMQVKNSFKKLLYNYCNDHRLRPIRIEYDEEHTQSKYSTGHAKVTSPISKVILYFYCNDFESIGIDPIRFLIPRMTA